MIRRFKLPSMLAAATAALGLSAGTATAQGYDGFTGFGGKVGIVDIDHLGTTLTLGAFGEFGLAPSVSLNVGVDFWQDSESHGGVKTSVRDIALSALGRYHFAPRGRLSPYLGAGLGLHMLRAEVTTNSSVIGRASYSDSESELGIDLAGGLLIPSGSSAWQFELRYRSVDDDYDVDHLALTFGILKPF